DGRALLANDMHLVVRVPNTWYRASLEWRDGANAASHRLIGVTLPGVPAVVVGSNTHVAWGFTNSQGDWSDIVLLEIDPNDSNRYRTPDGWAVRSIRRDDRGGRRGAAERICAMDDLGSGHATGSSGALTRIPLGRTRRRPPERVDHGARIG